MDEFHISEAGFRAVIESLHTLTEASNGQRIELDAANEAIHILNARIDLILDRVPV